MHHRDNHRPGPQKNGFRSGHPQLPGLVFDCRNPGQAVTAPGNSHARWSQRRCKSKTVPGQVLRRKAHEVAAATTQRQPNVLRKEAHNVPAASEAGRMAGVASELAAVGQNGRKEQQSATRPLQTKHQSQSEDIHGFAGKKR
jgi:hypothetical protein